jgi:stress-induced-phosphoprotein 1
MVDIAKATEAKARGNAAFTKGDFETAVTEFTAAIGFNPNDHVFFSNRSGAYASLKQFDKALEDADACIQLKPDWAKGYGRKGLALSNLRQWEEAKAAYSKGVEIDGNAACAQGLKDVESAMSRPKMEQTNPMGELFNESMW